jgi:hypothetical protein
MKLLVDEVRVWATHQKHRYLHLGGGATPNPHDQLLHFKRGFSDQVHDFTVWSWILAPYAYRHLCAEKTLWNHRHGLQTSHTKFFPEYRCPTIPHPGFTPVDEASERRLESLLLSSA